MQTSNQNLENEGLRKRAITNGEIAERFVKTDILERLGKRYSIKEHKRDFIALTFAEGILNMSMQ